MSISKTPQPVQWLRIPLKPDPRVCPSQDPCLYDQAAVLRNSQLWLFGGLNLPLQTVNVIDLETLQWTLIETRGASPSMQLPLSLQGHTVVTSPNGRYAILFGGEDFKTRTLSNRLLAFEFESKTWRVVNPTTEEAPQPRLWHTAVVNPFRDSMVVFGGANGRSGPTLADLWEFDFGKLQWKRISVTSAIEPRCVHRAVVDKNQRRMLIIGGGSYMSKFDEIYSINLDTYDSWKKLNTKDGPPKMCRHSLVTDTDGRVVMFGGESTDSKPWRDVWILNPDEQTWTPTSSTYNVAPPATEGHVACMYKNSMYIVGGSGNKPNEVWVCTVGGSLKQDISAMFDEFR